MNYCCWYIKIPSTSFSYRIILRYCSCIWDWRQLTATLESTISNPRDTIWNCNRGQTSTTIESKYSNAGDAIAYCYKGQTATTKESSISNACDAIRNRYWGQTDAILESTLSNAFDAIGNHHRGQTAATIESAFSNACDTVAENDRCQARAIIESTFSNAWNICCKFNNALSCILVKIIRNNSRQGTWSIWFNFTCCYISNYISSFFNNSNTILNNYFTILLITL